jgi:hypothetical protein
MSGALSDVALNKPTYALNYNDLAGGLYVRIRVDMGRKTGTLIFKYDRNQTLLRRPRNSSRASEQKTNFA